MIERLGMNTALNIADRLRTSAAIAPYQRAVVFPAARDRSGRVAYTQLTFEQLDREADQIAHGLIRMGVRPGHRLVLMVRPSLEFIALTFGIFRAGAVCTLIDPGMGRSGIFRCLEKVDPDGFLAIPPVHLIRRLMVKRFRNARFNVIVGVRGYNWGCRTYRQLLESGADASGDLPQTSATDPAAIIFTSGSTGPPKGVMYEHGMFDGQVELIRDHYQISPGEIDLPGFPMFALFNVAMQVTTVIPDMDPTRPARVDPRKHLEAIANQGVTQAFGSPSLWNRLGRYCAEQRNNSVSQHVLPSIRRILSAGAPVPLPVLRLIVSELPADADIHTPYGATECLPVASIGGREVLDQTAMLTAQGRGTCVGRIFDRMQVKIIQTCFDAIPEISAASVMSLGEIGEIIVRGPVATRQYFKDSAATAMAKIQDGEAFWHRMGDTGYFDEHGRLWFCGRKAHIVFTADGPMYSVCCEAIFNNHSEIYRCALVGVGIRGRQIPVIVAEPEPGHYPQNGQGEQRLRSELLALGQDNPLTCCIRHILFHRGLPVDTRHNVKINRELLANWAAGFPNLN